jgi:hypothetical protein
MTAPTIPPPLLDPDALIPDLLREHPRLRPVLDRYGLRGCGGPLGPSESLRFFARAHGVDEGSLLAELDRALATAPESAAPSHGAAAKPPAYEPGPADTIYRRFFKAGIAIVLTAGAAWGALLLLRIGFSGAFGAVSIHDVNAHGHAQIFGWIGLFVMGFAYQAFPRFLHTELPWPKLALASFWLMVAGIAIRVACEPFAPGKPLLVGAGLAAGALELLAIGAFLTVIGTTFVRARRPIEPFGAYAIAGLAFFLVQAVGDLLLFAATATAGDAAAVVARYQPALRDVQIHGFALLMVLGVSQRFFPAMYGYPAIEGRTAWWALPILVAGVLAESLGSIAMRTAGGGFSSAPGLVSWGGALVIALAATTLVRRMEVLHASPESDRSTKFFRAAFAWLLVSLALLVAMPAYLEWTGLAFSHAYAGAVRHAITVGFLSLMILGVAAKVVPTLCGVDPRRLGALFVPFALVNLGCALRVGFQVATDFRPEIAFRIAGVSGLLEVAGITVWGIGLWRLMSRRAHDDAAIAAAPRPARASASDKVGPLVDAAPDLLPVFLRHGFRPLANPLFRRTVGRTVSVAGACAMHGVDEATLIADLNEVLAAGRRPEPPAVDPAMAVAEIVRRRPAAAGVLVSRGLDVCCGGTKSLAEAAEKHGVDLDEILAEIERASGPGESRVPLERG